MFAIRKILNGYLSLKYAMQPPFRKLRRQMSIDTIANPLTKPKQFQRHSISIQLRKLDINEDDFSSHDPVRAGNSISSLSHRYYFTLLVFIFITAIVNILPQPISIRHGVLHIVDVAPELLQKAVRGGPYALI